MMFYKICKVLFSWYQNAEVVASADFLVKLNYAEMMHADCKIHMNFAGASPARRDYGRGHTAAQWARYCGRYMCAESIEKFVRTAVQHGGSGGGGGLAGVISISSDSQQSLKVKKSKKNNGESRIRSVILYH